MKKIFILQTAVFICLWGCADDESGYSGQIENIDETIYENVEPADPYSLESMQAAFDAMSETRASVEYMFEPDSPKKEFVVYATHHQVKFTVTSMEQWEKLESDDELCLLGMPISRLNSLTDEEIAAKLKEDAEEDEDYESRYLIKDEGGNIIAKDLTYDEIAAMIDNDEISDEADIEEMIVSEANPINLWATVSYKYIAPEGIKIDIVNRFFIPNEFYDNKDGVLRSDGYYLTKSFIADLVDLSNDISGVSKENRYAGGSYYPMGKITYYDDILNVEKPLEGARIVAVSGNICHTGIIDARGDFFIPSAVQGSCRYFIYFYTDEFKVKSSRKNIASLFCKSTADFLTYRISKAQDGINYYYTTVFRAAYYYYNKDVLGTKRPPTVIKIWARDKAKNVPNGNFSCFRVFWGGNTIHIFKPDRSTDQIYGTTIHELTHAAHYSMGKKNYKKTHDIIKESWARGTQYFITLKTYPSYKGGGLQ